MNTDNGNVNSEVKKAVGRGSRQALKIFNRADIWIYFQKQEKTKVITLRGARPFFKKITVFYNFRYVKRNPSRFSRLVQFFDEGRFR